MKCYKVVKNWVNFFCPDNNLILLFFFFITFDLGLLIISASVLLLLLFLSLTVSSRFSFCSVSLRGTCFFNTLTASGEDEIVWQRTKFTSGIGEQRGDVSDILHPSFPNGVVSMENPPYSVLALVQTYKKIKFPVKEQSKLKFIRHLSIRCLWAS